LGRDFKAKSRLRGIPIDRKNFAKFQADSGPKLAILRAELIKKYRCSPLPAMIVPLVIHIPVFVLATTSLRHASIAPTPLTDEAFMSDVALALTDPFGLLPLSIGFLALGNYELNRRFFAVVGSRKPWSETLENTIRGATIVVVGVAMMAPGSVTLYWFTSSLFTLAQTITLGIMDNRADKRALVPKPTPIDFSPLGAIRRTTPPSNRYLGIKLREKK